MSWEEARRRALARLRDHLDRGLVDSDIAFFLERFNSSVHCAFTTSSCSGRLVVLEGPSLFDKRSAVIVAQTHDPSDCSTVIGEALKEPGPGRIRWLSLQPPILHFAARTIDTAQSIVRLAETAGFNRACYKRYRHGGFHVEVAASDKLHVIGGSEAVVREACAALQRYKEKLGRLVSLLLTMELCR